MSSVPNPSAGILHPPRSAQPALARGRATLFNSAINGLPTVLFYSFLFPAGLSFQLGALNFFLYRVVLILSLPLLIAQQRRVQLKWTLPDAFLVAAIVWIFLSFFANRGVLGGLESGGRDGIDLAGAYLIGRLCIRDERDFQRMLKLVIPGLLGVGAVLAFESITGKFRFVTMFPLPGAAGGSLNEYRFGLLRAFGPFSHAILGGLLMSSFISLYVFGLREKRLKPLGVVGAMMGLFTLSSAAFASIGAQLALFAYRLVRQFLGYKRDWRPLAFGLLVLIILLQLLTKGGAVKTIIRFASINQGSGFYRLIIWDYGTKSVAAHPLFGIGYAGYERERWMGESIDNHWLLLAVRYGLAEFVLMAGLTILLLIRLARASARLPAQHGGIYTGLFICLFCLSFGGLSVAFINEFQAYFIFLLGGSASLTAMFDRRRQLALQLIRARTSRPITASAKAARTSKFASLRADRDQ